MGVVISHINQTSLLPLEIPDVYALLIGKRGSRVSLSVVNRGSETPPPLGIERTYSIQRTPSDIQRTSSLEKRERKRRKEAGVTDNFFTVALVREVLPHNDFEERFQKEMLVQQQEEKDFYLKAAHVLEPYTGVIEEPVPMGERLRVLVESEGFADTISLIIVLNTIALAMQHELTSEVGALWAGDGSIVRPYLLFRLVLEGFNLVFLFIYTAEMGLKIAGLGLKEYLSRGSNLLDGTIVGIGMRNRSLLT